MLCPKTATMKLNAVAAMLNLFAFVASAQLAVGEPENFLIEPQPTSQLVLPSGTNSAVPIIAPKTTPPRLPKEDSHQKRSQQADPSDGSAGPLAPSQSPSSSSSPPQLVPTSEIASKDIDGKTMPGLPSGQIKSDTNNSVPPPLPVPLPMILPNQQESSHEQLIDGDKKIIDLSHPLNDNTLHWPENKGFKLTMTKVQQDPYYKSEEIAMATHTGTHIDAPIHFNKAGWSVDQIPLDRLVDVELSIVDLSGKVGLQKTYQFVSEDFINPRTNESLVKKNSILLVYTGLSKNYDQGAKAYMGTDTNHSSQLLIPTFTKDAAEYIASQDVFGVGLDSPSVDGPQSGKQVDHVAHRIFNGKNIYILENISGKLAGLIDQNVSLRAIIAPLPITGASGSPIRMVVMTGHSDCPEPQRMARNSAQSSLSLLSCNPLFTILISISALISLHNRAF